METSTEISQDFWHLQMHERCCDLHKKGTAVLVIDELADVMGTVWFCQRPCSQWASSSLANDQEH